MTSIIVGNAGNGLGLQGTSPDQQNGPGAMGNSAVGSQGPAQDYVNVTTGNLVVQTQDEFISSTGLVDESLFDTYNSLGSSLGTAQNDWVLSVGASLSGITATTAISPSGTTITFNGPDGHTATFIYTTGFLYNSVDGLASGTAAWVNNSDPGVNQYISYDSTSNQWIFHEGSTGQIQVYSNTSGQVGRLLSSMDLNGNTISYTYNTAGRVTQMTDSQGQYVKLTYDSTNTLLQSLTAKIIKPGATANTTTQTLLNVTYSYDTNTPDKRLTGLKVELTPLASLPNPSTALDSNVFQVQYSYYGTTNLIKQVLQSDGSVLNITYNQTSNPAASKVTQLTDGLGHSTSFTYNTGSTTVTDAFGNATIYTYSTTAGTDARITSLTLPAAVAGGSTSSISYQYDSNNNISQVTDADGRIVQYQYDSRHNIIQMQDQLGNTVLRTYDVEDHLLTETRFLQPQTFGTTIAPSSATSSNSVTTYYVYDGTNNGSINRASTSKENLSFVISPAGRVTQYLYNTQGQLTSTLVFTGATFPIAIYGSVPITSTMTSWANTQLTTNGTAVQRTDTAYDLTGQIKTETTYNAISAAGVTSGANVTTYIYDAFGRLLTKADADATGTTKGAAHVTTYTYDGIGRPLTVTNGANQTTTYVYGALATALPTTAGTGVVGPGGQDQTVTATSNNGLVTTTVYDADGETLSVSQAKGSTSYGTSYDFYDLDGHRVMTVDPTGARTIYLFDARGRQVGTISPQGELTETVYNNDNQVIQTIQYATLIPSSALGNYLNASTSFSTAAGGLYIATAKLLSLSTLRPAHSGQDRSTYSYYNSGDQLAYTIDGAGYVTGMTYDTAGQITSQTQYWQPISSPPTGGLASSIAPTANPGQDRTTWYLYDKDELQTGTVDADGFLTQTFYDSAGNRIQQATYGTAVSYNGTQSLSSLVTTASASGTRSQYWFYDNQDRVVGTLDQNNILTGTTYDSAGNLQVQTRYAKPVSYTNQSLSTLTGLASIPGQDQVISHDYYDGLNRVTQSTDQQGTQTQYNYDPTTGFLNSVVSSPAQNNQLGVSDQRTTDYLYDDLGRVTNSLSGVGSSLYAANSATVNNDGVTNTYDLDGRTISSTDADGDTSYFYYDSDGRLAYTVDADGNVSQNQYNAFGQVSQTTKYATPIATAGLTGGAITSAFTSLVVASPGQDQTTQYGFDNRGLATSTTDALLDTSSQSFDAFGRLTSSTDAAGNITTSQYSTNATQHLVSVTDPLGNTTVTATDAWGRTVQATDALDNTTVTSYGTNSINSINNLPMVSVTDALGNTTATTYDAFGRTLQVQDAAGNLTQYQYTDSTQTQTVTDALGNTTTTVYNRYGQVIQTQDALGNLTTYTYNADGDLIETSDPAGAVTQSVYDVAGRLMYGIDAMGDVTGYQYDADGRVIQTTRYSTPIQLSSLPANPSALDVQLAITQVVANYATNGNPGPTGLVATGGAISLNGSTATVTPSGAYSSMVGTVQTVATQGSVVMHAEVSQSNLSGPGFYVGATGAQSNGNGVQMLAIFIGNTVSAYTALNGAQTANVQLGTLTAGVAYSTDVVVSGSTVTLYVYPKGQSRTGAGAYSYSINQTWKTAANFIQCGTGPSTSVATIRNLQEYQPLSAITTGNEVTQSVYNALGQVAYSIDAMGDVAGYQYDADGRVIQTTRYSTPIQLSSLPANPSALDVQLAITQVVANYATNGNPGPTGLVATGGAISLNGSTATVTPSGAYSSMVGTVQTVATQGSVVMHAEVSQSNLSGPGFYVGATGAQSNGNGVQMLAIFIGNTVSAYTALNGAQTANVQLGTLTAGVAYSTDVVVSGSTVTLYVYPKGQSRTGAGAYSYSINQTWKTAANFIQCGTGPSTSVATIRNLQEYQPLSAITTGNEVTQSVYNALGQVAYSIDAMGDVAGYQYDADGRVIQTTRYSTPIQLSSLPANPSALDVQLAITQVVANYATNGNPGPTGLVATGGAISLNGSTATVTPSGAYSSMVGTVQTVATQGSVVMHAEVSQSNLSGPGFYVGATGAQSNGNGVQMLAIFIGNTVSAYTALNGAQTANVQLGTLTAGVAYSTDVVVSGSTVTLYVYPKGQSRTGAGAYSYSINQTWKTAANFIQCGTGPSTSVATIRNLQEYQPLSAITTGNEVTQSVYNALGQVAYSIDAMGDVAGYQYDADGRVIQTTRYSTPIQLSSLPANPSALDVQLAITQVVANYATNGNPGPTGLVATGGAISLNGSTATVTPSGAYSSMVGTVQTVATQGSVVMHAEVSQSNLSGPGFYVGATGAQSNGNGVQMLAIFIGNTVSAYTALNGAQTANVQLGTLTAGVAYSTDVVVSGSTVTLYVYPKGQSRTGAGAYSYSINQTWKTAANFIQCGTGPSTSVATIRNLQEYQPLSAITTGNEVTQSVYNALGQVAYSIDAMGDVAGYQYDADGRVIQTTRYSTPIQLSSLPANPSALDVQLAITQVVANYATNGNPGPTGLVATGGAISLNGSTATVTPSGAYSSMVGTVQTVATQGSVVMHAEVSQSNLSGPGFYVGATGAQSNGNGVQMLAIFIGNTVSAYTALNGAQTANVQLGTLTAGVAYSTDVVVSGSTVTLYVYPKGQSRTGAGAYSYSINQTWKTAANFIQCGTGPSTSVATIRNLQEYQPLSAITTGNEVTQSVYNALGQVAYSIDAMGDVAGYQYDADGRVIQTTRYSTPIQLSSLPANPSALDVQLAITQVVANYATNGNPGPTGLVATGGAISLNGSTATVTPSGAYSSMVGTVQTVATQGSVVMHAEVSQSNLSGPGFYVGATGAQSNGNGVQMLAIFIGNTVSAYTALNGAQTANVQLGTLTAGVAYSTDVVVSGSTVTLYVYPKGQSRTGAGAYSYSINQTWKTAANFIQCGTGPSTSVATIRNLQEYQPLSAITTGNEVTQSVYNALGQVAYSIDAMGDVTGYQYDQDGRVTQTTRYATPIQLSSLPANPGPADVAKLLTPGSSDEFSSNSYYLNGLLQSVTDVYGNTQTYNYDAFDNKVSYTNQIGNTWLYQYNANNEMTEEIDPVAATYALNGAGSASTLNNSSTQVAKLISYDSFGDVLSSTDGYVTLSAGSYTFSSQQVTDYLYDLDNRQVRTISAANGGVGIYNASNDQPTNYSGVRANFESSSAIYSDTYYDAMGNAIVGVDGYTDSNGAFHGTYSYKVYDALNRVVDDVDGERGLTVTAYDTFGNSTSVTRYASSLNESMTANAATGNSGSGTATLLSLEGSLNGLLSLNSTTGLANPDNTAAALTAAEAAQGQIELLLGSAYGAPSAVNERTITTTYDLLNRKTLVTQPAVDFYTDSTSGAITSGYASPQTTYSYDSFGNIISQAVNDTAAGDWVISWSGYNADNQQTDQVDGLGFYTHTSYDSFGRLSETYQYANALATIPTTLPNFASFTAPAPSVATKANPYPAAGADRDTVYGYDLLDRQTSVTRVGVVTSSLDGNGNVITTVGNQTTQTGYDAVGNVITQTDALGNTTTTYYDALGRVIGVQQPTRTSTANDSEITLQSVSATALPVSGTTLQFEWDSLQAWGPNSQIAVIANVNYNYVSWTTDSDGDRIRQVTPINGSVNPTIIESNESDVDTGATIDLGSGAQDINLVSFKVVTYVGTTPETIFDSTVASDQSQMAIGQIPTTAANVKVVCKYTTLNSTYTGKSYTLNAVRCGSVWLAPYGSLPAAGNYSYTLTVTDNSGNPVDLTGVGGQNGGSFTLTTPSGGPSFIRADGSPQTVTPLTAYEYDYLGNKIAEVNYSTPDVAAPTNAGVAAGLDPANDQYTYTTYDLLGQAIRTDDADGDFSYQSFNAFGQVARQWQIQTDSAVTGQSMTAVTTFGYDRDGRQTSTLQIVRSPLAGVADQWITHGASFDSFGEQTGSSVIQSGPGLGVTTVGSDQEMYDNDGRLIQTNQDGTDVISRYDLMGNATAKIVVPLQGATLAATNSYVSGAKAPTAPNWVNINPGAGMNSQINPLFGTIETDTVYDRLGRAIGQVDPSFSEAQETPNGADTPVTIGGLGTASWSNLASSVQSYTVGTQVVGLVGIIRPQLTTYSVVTNVTLSWASLGVLNLGTAPLTVAISYNTKNGGGVAICTSTDNSDDVGQEDGTLLTAKANDSGVTLTFAYGDPGGDPNAKVTSISSVTVSANINGNPTPVRSSLAGTGTVAISVPEASITGGTLYYRAHGSTGAYKSLTLTNVNASGGSSPSSANLYIGSGGASQGDGTYDYYFDTQDTEGNFATVNDGHFQGSFTISGGVAGSFTAPAQATLQGVHGETLDRWGNELTSTDAVNGAVTAYAYNDQNQLEVTTEPLVLNGNTDTMQAPVLYGYYDADGNEIATRDANGNLTQEYFDNGGNRVEEVRADGTIWTWGYDVLGRNVQTRDGAGNATNMFYDQMNRLVEQDLVGYTSTQDLTTSYSYDEAGNKVSSTDAMGDVTEDQFDTAGHIVRELTPMAVALGSTTSFTTTYAYNALGQKSSATNGDGVTEIWKYDYFGRLDGHTDLSGGVYTYTYDSWGRVHEQSNTVVTQLENNAGSNLNVTTGGADQVYSYYANGQLKQVNDTGLVVGTSGNRITQYEYDVDGRQTLEVYESGSGASIYQSTHTYYDAIGRVIAVRDDNYMLNYSYDLNGNRLTVGGYSLAGIGIGVAPVAEYNSYGYDADNRIDYVNGQSVGYNKAGDRVYEGNATDGYQNYSYNADNQLLDTWYSNSPTSTSGNPLTARTYDAAGRMISYLDNTTENSYGTIAPELQSLYYNKNGELLSQVTETEPNEAWTISNQVDYGSSLHVTEDSNGNLSGVTDGSAIQGYYDGAGNASTYVVRDGSNSITATYQYDYLALGDGYQVGRESGSGTVQGIGISGTTTYTFDRHGQTIEVSNPNSNVTEKDYIVSGAGEIVQETDTGTEPYTGGYTQNDFYYYDQDSPVGDSINGFNYNYTPISSQYPATSPGQYIVQSSSETLQSIAQMEYGDSSLWYLIADANGLGDATNQSLTAGESLTIPNQVTNVNNNANTDKPYDPNPILGNNTPTLKVPPPPGDPKDHCRALSEIIGGVVQVIVDIVVTIVTFGNEEIGAAAGAFAGYGSRMTSDALINGNYDFGKALRADTGITLMDSLVTGHGIGQALKETWSASVDPVAVGAPKWSAEQALIIAAAAFAGGEIGEAAGPVMSTVVGAAATDALTQVGDIAVGMQKKFSWNELAGSAIGAAVGAVLTGAESGIAPSDSDFGLGADASRAGLGMLNGFVSGAVQMAIANGGKMSWSDVAADAFGNALGNSIADVTGLTAAEQQVMAQKQQVQAQQQAGGGSGIAVDPNALNFGNLAAIQAKIDSTDVSDPTSAGNSTGVDFNDFGSGNYTLGTDSDTLGGGDQYGFAPTTPASAGTYTVQPGDNRYSIAQMLYGNGNYASQLTNADGSPMGDGSLIFPGQVLNAPPPGSFDSQQAINASVGMYQQHDAMNGFLGLVDSLDGWSGPKTPGLGDFMSALNVQDPPAVTRSGFSLLDDPTSVYNNPVPGYWQAFLDEAQMPKTLQIGLAGSVSFEGGSVPIGFGLAVDSSMHFAPYFYTGLVGAAGAEADWGLSVQLSNAHSVTDLSGPFINGSVHGGAGYGGSLDYFNGWNSDGSSIAGGGFTLGAAVGASASLGGTCTYVWTQANGWDAHNTTIQCLKPISAYNVWAND